WYHSQSRRRDELRDECSHPTAEAFLRTRPRMNAIPRHSADLRDRVRRNDGSDTARLSPRASVIAPRRAEEERAGNAFLSASDDEVGEFRRDARAETRQLVVWCPDWP